MTEKKLEKQQWRGFFDRVSKSIAGKRAEIEVASLAIGDQIEAEWLPLLGIVYDPKHDAVEVLLEGLSHLIRSPREVQVAESLDGLARVIVVDADDVLHIVRLRDPLMLPAPPASLSA